MRRTRRKPCACARRSRSSRNASRCSSGSRSRKRTASPRKSSRSATGSELGRGMAGLPTLPDILEEYQLVDAEDRYRLLLAAVQDKPAAEVAAMDVAATLAPFELAKHLSANRTQGVPNMIALVKQT